jgi:hypothetical protein
MSKEQKLVNKLKRRERFVREPKKDTYKVDKNQETLQASPRAQKLMRKPQRRMDASFGYDMTGHEGQLEYKCVAASLTRFDFGGSDFGLKLTLPAIAGNKGEVSKVTTVADVAGSLNDTYFLLDTTTTDYYVWYDVSAGGTDPLIAGRTGIAVAISTGDTAAAVATATAAAVGAVSAKFTAGAVGAVVTITDKQTGDVPDTTDGAVPTGFSFATTTQGAQATMAYTQEIGVIAGDLVVIEQDGSQVENRMLEVVQVVDTQTLRLDDVPTFSGTETNVSVRFILSGVKKSYS